jgi:two-component system sensor histidine kinase BaeS
MNIHSPFANMSLQWKLVLSYLAVAMGAMLVLIFVLRYAVVVYFAQAQLATLKLDAAHYQIDFIDPVYLASGQLDSNDLNAAFAPPRHEGLPGIAVAIADTQGNIVFCNNAPGYVDLGDCSSPGIQQALNQAAQQQTAVSSNLDLSPDNLDLPPGSQASQEPSSASAPTPGMQHLQYLVEPLYIQTQSQKQFIGTIFLAMPAADTSDFLGHVTESMFLAGILISLAAGLFSLALAHSFTRPIMRLTRAAERLKRGQYAERVPAATSQDELGMLAQTFNEMATQIEADVNELRNQEQVRRELIANIAHDLATPLTAIQGFSEAMADNMLPDPQAQQETAQRIAREVQRLRRLVSDMQNMTAMESGRLRLDLAPLDVHSLVDETLAVIAPECENKGITLLNQTNRSTPLVMADSDRITQVLLNLLDNARRHTPSGGTITVNAAPRDQELCVWVSDTGSGIDAKDLPHIFERFYRADRSRAASTGGSGLGLAIVKAIITAHGGRIWAQSTPGKGTIIAFTLPLVKAPEQNTRSLSKPGLQKVRS